MRTRTLTLVGALVVGATWAAAPPPPAGAAVVVTSSGTTVTAITSGVSSTIALQCQGGSVAVLNTLASPTLPCGALTAATFLGDGTAERFGPHTALASFPALAQITVSAGGGADRVNGTPGRDVVSGGIGDDRVTLPAGGADDQVGLGGSAGDVVIVTGTAAGDTISVATGSPTSQTVVTRQAWDVVVTTTSDVEVDAGAGGDVVDATGVTAASTLDRVSLRGDAGGDVLRCGTVSCTLVGGTGTNTLQGGPDDDALFSTSATDTLRGLGSTDGLSDSGDGPVGGRTIDTTGTGANGDNYQVSIRGDAALRSRALPAIGARVTAALGRSGRQVVDLGVDRIIYDTAFTATTPVDRVVLDLATLPDQSQTVLGDAGTVVDVVVPTGSWSVSGDTVTTTDGYEPIGVDPDATLLVRAPFTDPELRVAHRLIRDLLMRLPTPAERNGLRAALEGGTLTRSQAVLQLSDGDPYRGVQVDRAFVDVLRRGVDAGGRAYWIDRLDDGLVLRRLRASLYGSDEYFAEWGFGQTATYVAAAYADVLGRTAADAEIAYWVAQIEDVGLPRGTVADRFLNTLEARRLVIRDLFVRWLDREPTASEQALWGPLLASSSTDGELALTRFLAGTAAYFDRPDA